MIDNKDSPKNVPNLTPAHIDDTQGITLEKSHSNALNVTNDPDDLTLEKTPSDAQPSLDNNQTTVQNVITDPCKHTQNPIEQLPPLEKIPPNTPTQMKNTFNAETELRNQESILEKNLPNALSPVTSPLNTAIVKTDLESILEINPLNAHTLRKSPFNATNVKTDLDPILEKSPLNTHTLKKFHPNTDLKMSTVSPHLLRQTNARKYHTYV